MHKIEFDRIAEQEDKTLVGMRRSMSLAENTTASLWGSFMPRRGEVTGAIGDALYSVQHYSSLAVFENFTPQSVFEKWAAVEVESDLEVPEGMDSFLLRGGHFAVFDHRGPASEFHRSMQYIFGDWLGQSQWRLDDREHFEVLRQGWRADDPEAQEEIWIPVIK